jgi:polyphosphate kinase 2 (PPK2 family)
MFWKLSDLDLRSYGRWYDYSRARDDMFVPTDCAWAPWYLASTDDQKRSRLNVITHLLSRVPYELRVTVAGPPPIRGRG